MFLYKASTLCGNAISGKDEPKEGQVCELTTRRRMYQSKSQEEAALLPVQALLDRCTPARSPASLRTLHQGATCPFQAIHALASFLHISPLSSFVAGC